MEKISFKLPRAEKKLTTLDKQKMSAFQVVQNNREFCKLARQNRTGSIQYWLLFIFKGYKVKTKIYGFKIKDFNFTENVSAKKLKRQEIMLSREILKSLLGPKDKVPKSLLCITLVRIYDFE